MLMMAVGQGEQLRLHYALCRRRILTLDEAYLSWPARSSRPVEPQWVHKRCGEGAQPKRKLWQGEYALRTLIASLVTPALPRLSVQHLNGPRRPWGRP
jgi:hypothetical protein